MLPNADEQPSKLLKFTNLTQPWELQVRQINLDRRGRKSLPVTADADKGRSSVLFPLYRVIVLE